ncbi:hypothetical protein U1Q18_034415 [Sarracenia purpurea var. burkii]
MLNLHLRFTPPWMPPDLIQSFKGLKLQDLNNQSLKGFSSFSVAEYLFAGDVIKSMEKYGRDLVNSVMRRAEEVCRDFNTNIKVEKKVGTGDAKDVICIAVEKLGADILVMGSHDYGFFKRALLGSVSDHCAKYVKCPLLVVKRPKNV